jgi:hypothetical protein
MNRGVVDSVSQLLGCGEYNVCKTGNACSKNVRNETGAPENPVPAILPESCRLGQVIYTQGTGVHRKIFTDEIPGSVTGCNDFYER